MLSLQDGAQLGEAGYHGRQQVGPQGCAVVDELAERLFEAVHRQLAAVVLVAADEAGEVHLVYLGEGRKKWYRHQQTQL